MIDIGSIVKLAAEMVFGYKDARDDLQKTDKNSLEFLNTRSAKTGYFAAGVAYITAGVYSIGISLSEMVVSGPHQLAVLAACSPPIVNIALFGFGTVYQLARLTREIFTQNPYPQEFPEHLQWQREKSTKIGAILTSLAVCAVFLAASLTPVPGGTNVLGGICLVTLIGVDMIRSGINLYAAHITKQKNDGKATPVSDFINDSSNKVGTTISATVSSVVSYAANNSLSSQAYSAVPQNNPSNTTTPPTPHSPP